MRAAPPDGMIARRYSQLEDGLTDGGRRYMYDCLLKGMRGDPMPDPRPEDKVGKADGVLIQQKARRHLPQIEEIRAGELELAAGGPERHAQEAMPF